MAGLTTDNIKDPMAAAVSTALLAATHSVNIKPFKPIGTDKFKQTVSWKRWIGHFDKLIACFKILCIMHTEQFSSNT